MGLLMRRDLRASLRPSRYHSMSEASLDTLSRENKG